MVEAPPAGWRSRMRATRGGAWLLKAVVLVVGAFFIVLGGVLIVLPGPLTIPPILLGVWIWSTEFTWAERLRVRVAARARVVWAATKRRPMHATAATASGLLLLVAVVVAAKRYDVLGRLMDALG